MLSGKAKRADVVRPVVLGSLLLWGATGCSWLGLESPNTEELNVSTTGVAAATGAVIGGGLGAVIGSESGSVGGGIAIGSIAGAAAGGVIGREVENRQASTVTQQERLRRQKEILNNQSEQLRELKEGSDDSIAAQTRAALASPHSEYDRPLGSGPLRRGASRKSVSSEQATIQRSPVREREIPVATSVPEARVIQPKVATVSTPSATSAAVSQFSKPSSPANNRFQAKPYVAVMSGDVEAPRQRTAPKSYAGAKPSGNKRATPYLEASARGVTSRTNSSPSNNLKQSNARLQSESGTTKKQLQEVRGHSQEEGGSVATQTVKSEAPNGAVVPNGAGLPSGTPIAGALPPAKTLKDLEAKELGSNDGTQEIKGVSAAAEANEDLGEKTAAVEEKPAEVRTAQTPPQKETTTVASATKGSADPCVKAEEEANRAKGAVSEADQLFYLRRALRLCPNGSHFHLEIGKVYSALGRVEDAEYEFRQAVELDPANGAAREQLAQLQKGTN